MRRYEHRPGTHIQGDARTRADRNAIYETFSELGFANVITAQQFRHRGLLFSNPPSGHGNQHALSEPTYPRTVCSWAAAKLDSIAARLTASFLGTFAQLRCLKKGREEIQPAALPPMTCWATVAIDRKNELEQENPKNAAPGTIAQVSTTGRP